MNGGNVSDASPPRRRSRRDRKDLTERTDSAIRPDGAGITSHATSDFVGKRGAQPSGAPHRDESVPAGASSHLQTSPSGYERSHLTTGDVSDASPPRRRRSNRDQNQAADGHNSDDEGILPMRKASKRSRFDETPSDQHMKRHAGTAATYKRRGGASEDVIREQPLDRSRRKSSPGPAQTSRLPVDENASVRSDMRSNVDPASRHDAILSSREAPSFIPTFSTRKAPPNRYGILAGPRWDGVDRSNGFEVQLEAMKAKRKDLELEAYRASVADM